MSALLLTAANQNGGSGTSGILMILIYAAIIVVGYLLLVRPSKKEKKRMASMMDAMQPGDTVVTNNGFYGVLIDVQEDTVIVEFGSNRNCRIPMKRAAIAEIEKAEDGLAENGKDAKGDKKADASKEASK